MLRIINNYFFIFFFFIFAFNLIANEVPEEFETAKIEPKIGKSITQDLEFINSDGDIVYIKDYIGDKPVILNFVYYTCPRLCNIISDSLLDTLKRLDSSLYSKFRVLSVSFDHRDTVDTSHNFKNKYVNALTNDNANIEWHFLTGSKDNIFTLTQSAGFNYYFNKKSNQYAHGAALIFLTPDGIISRYLYGISYSSFDLKLSILEASDRKLISSLDSVLLYCYSYDPDEKGFVLEAMIFMKVGATISLLFFMFFLYNLWKSDFFTGKDKL